MKNKICLLGNNSIYTKIVCKKFDEMDIDYTLILENPKYEYKSYFDKIFSIPMRLKRKLTSGRYKGLPKTHWFTWKLLIDDLLFKSSKIYKELVNPYTNYVPKKRNIFYVPHVNDELTIELITKYDFDIGIFAGVGIVDESVIEKFNKFCLNAHPAPLPECRGGGALENTLYYNLNPSVSVHYATAGIDEGDILKIVELPLKSNDTFNTISLKLSILCGETLAGTILDIEHDKHFNEISNEGILHYWKDCTLSRQKRAHKNLKHMLTKVKK